MATTVTVKSTIQTATHNYKADDITDYSAVTYFSDSKSVLKLEGPSTTLYNNTNFGSPDFNYPGDLTQNINIPLISSLIPQGAYTLTTTTRVTKILVPVLSVTLGTNSILVPVILDGNFVPGQTVVWTLGANAGSYVVQSATTGIFGVTVVFVGTLPSSSTTGSIGFDEEIITVDPYAYCYDAPTPDLVLTPNCATATLVVSETTDYSITCEGQSIQPTTNTHVYTLNAPQNSGGQPVYDQQVSTVAPFSTTELWTQTWSVTVVSTLVYILPSGLYIETSVTGSTQLNVNCDATLCCLSTCLQNAVTAWIAAQTQGPGAISKAMILQMNIQSAFMLYSIGVACGNATLINLAVARMQAYLSDTNCCSDCSDNGQSVQVVALYNVIVSGTNLVLNEGDAYIVIDQVVTGSTTDATFTLNTTLIETLIDDYIIANPSIVTDIVESMRLRTNLTPAATSFDISCGFDGVSSIGSPIVTGIAFFSPTVNINDISEGDGINSLNFPYNTTILSISVGGDITMSQNATANGTSSFNVGYIYGGIQAIKLKRTIAGEIIYAYLLATAPTKSIEFATVTGGQYIQLVGDETTPDNFDFYAVNGSGNKVWLAFLTAVANYTKTNASATSDTIPVATKVTGNSLSLAAGTWLITSNAYISGGFADDIIVLRLEDAATPFVAVAHNVANVLTVFNSLISFTYVYTSGSAITLTSTYQASNAILTNGLKQRTLTAIRIA